MADQNRDLVLALGTFAHILDRSKGHINVNVGPFKTTASETDVPVKWNGTMYERIANLEQAIQAFTTAEEGFYVVLQNPAVDGKAPKEGTSSVAMPLEVGRKINIPGPVSFPLWPGQSTDIIEGHHLRSNQYLVVRVYNDVQAKANWDKAIIRRVNPSSTTPETKLELTMGQLLVIKGTDVAFYIPPTGVEVVKDVSGNYVREAATLERLEYAILLDENGNKTYKQGPDVVFPKPTETFVVKDGVRKFRAIELSEISGIHVKVIAKYDNHDVGEELFITGKETAIYFPRPEHAIIKYDDREIHFAVAIPDGEARYVLQRVDNEKSGRKAGTVRMVNGPLMFLPDPREEVVVRRRLDTKLVQMLYPGNVAALQYNEGLAQEAERSSLAPCTYSSTSYANYLTSSSAISSKELEKMRGVSLVGDAISRKNSFTPPRTITLDNKFEGVVNIQLWTGFAMLIVNSAGKRRVAVGPCNVKLEYDEVPQAFELSTGKPKTTDNLLRTVYLKVQHNQVSDIIRVTTKDMVDVDIKVSYRVDFQPEKQDKWFQVDNYVKFLCDHARSLLKNIAKQASIAEFYNNAINIVRDTILGAATAETKRPGRVFDENGMVIYDVEVLDVKIANPEIASLLQSAQHKAVSDAILLTNKEREFTLTTRVEKIAQELLKIRDETCERQHLFNLDSIDRELEQSTKRANIEIELKAQKVTAQLDEIDAVNNAQKTQQSALDEIAKAVLARKAEEDKLALDRLQREVEIETNAIKEKMIAMTPDLMAVLQVFGDQALLQKLADALGPMAIAQNVPVVDVAKKMFAGTAFEPILNSLGKKVAQTTVQ